MSHESGWIGVDLDGTLAEYHGWVDGGAIGKPVPKMAARVRRWLSEGRDVRIFTARASHPSFNASDAKAIEQWCVFQLGQVLPITCVKDFQCVEFWDDRAVAVQINTGEAIRYTEEGSVNL